MTWQPPPGQFQPPPAQFQPRPPQANNDLATAALCLSLASLGILVVGTPFTFGFSMFLPAISSRGSCGSVAQSGLFWQYTAA